ncbi:hypothetical protein KIW84_056602 [Lathyrus oleraceus]|uniref:Uncharacterized protein n=1 Tax=Pisum sativum TaxID=3888 RepID=A0A9D5AJW5_PEA|nr:hypothetical protein KIW84_056602 [Pisum sativum]
MLDFLVLQGKDWQSSSNLTLRKIAIVDLDMSTTKKPLGHAIVILLLSRKAGVKDFISRWMVHPSQKLDVAWIANHPKKVSHTQGIIDIEERPTNSAGMSAPLTHDISQRVPLTEKGSLVHRDHMIMFCFMHDFYAHTSLPSRYITHKVDTWAATQHFRDCFSGDPPNPFFGRYPYPGIETTIQLG